jgi:hypothetical protein
MNLFKILWCEYNEKISKVHQLATRPGLRARKSLGQETVRFIAIFKNQDCAADFSLLNLPKGKGLGCSKPATNS